MKFERRFLTLYAITDRSWVGSQSLVWQVEKAIQGGATMIQYREKHLDWEARLAEASELRKLTQKYGIPLIINDDLDLAAACGADGVHVGQSDMAPAQARKILGPEKILGVTAKTPEQVKAAQEGGADYLGSGAVFGSSTKTDAKPMSRETLKAICRCASVPVVAIGGISRQNIDRLAGTGISGVAVISGIFGEDDILEAAKELRRAMERLKLPPVLTIAGSDSSGGAGIQADLKTMAAWKTYGMSVITALTAQNTTGVYGIYPVTPEFVRQQMDCVFRDIFPFAVKIGMTAQAGLIRAIAEKLREVKAENIVLDPVMVSTSGSRLLEEEAVESLIQQLFPCARVITPNIPEARVLTGMPLRNPEDMEQAARILGEKYGTAVLLKGGHRRSDSAALPALRSEPRNKEASDVLYDKGKITWFSSEWIDNPNTHGTGCTLSSAIACGLARGETLEESIRMAKAYLNRALAFGLDLGRGSGPLNHGV